MDVVVTMRTESARRKTAREHLHRAGYKTGGAFSKDRTEDRADIERGVHEHEDHLHGGKHTRLKLKDGGMAMGGLPRPRGDKATRGKKGGNKVTVNVIHAGGGNEPGAPPAQPMGVPARPPVPAGPPPPQARPMMPPPGGGGLGMPPGGMPQRPPGMKRGGRVELKAGSGSGEGRLEKAAAEAKRPGGKR